MKTIQIKQFLKFALLCLLFVGCNDNILEEQPRSLLSPGFFKDEKGVQGGLTSMYAHLRFIYGNGFYYNSCQTGTDEATYGALADNNFRDLDMSGVGSITPTTSRSDVLWNNAFGNINTCNAVIEFAPAANISESLVSEARFFRAFDYFMLVQTFGGVPLDLGSGELKFNQVPSTTSVRNNVAEVYTKSVFPDLLKAVENLPVNSRLTGTVTKTTARLFLSKAYLTYAWWLQNPNNVDTYPVLSSRVDPDGHDPQWYFQKAYDVATDAIDSPGANGLQPTFYDVNVATKDRNKEILLYADHTEKSEPNNGGSLTFFSNAFTSENYAVIMMTWNYGNIRSTSPAIQTVFREPVQGLGRPFNRMCPPIDVIKKTFSDKTNDSRYDGTFATVYRANYNKNPGANAALVSVINANSLPIFPGSPVLTFLPDEPTTSITYSATTGNVGAGILPGRPDYVISPEGISRITAPGLWKLGVYRTDSGTGLGQFNAASTRPFNIAKFSEFYFIAAEAAVKGATTKSGKSARDLINVLRARAGKWSFDNAANVAKVQDNSAAMVAATPATIDINYILEERSRELYGEGYRWLDLVRTQKWEELASSYRICPATLGNHTPATITRTIEKKFYLRPIPQSQIDALSFGDADKKAYQNPGYNQ